MSSLRHILPVGALVEGEEVSNKMEEAVTGEEVEGKVEKMEVEEDKTGVASLELSLTLTDADMKLEEESVGSMEVAKEASVEEVSGEVGGAGEGAVGEGVAEVVELTKEIVEGGGVEVEQAVEAKVEEPDEPPPTPAIPPLNPEPPLPLDDEFNSNPQVNIEDMKAAQEELNEVDVLVCGWCHNVFHFVEEFGRHKQNCKRKSNFHGNIAETKPQVWAFLLWKNARTKVTRRGIPVEESSWKLYQKWCKMPERIRNAWVAAGETVMNFTIFGYTKHPDLSKFVKKQEKTETNDTEFDEEKPVVMRKIVQRDHLGEIKEIRSSGGMKRKLKDDIENIRNQLEDGDSSVDKEKPEGNDSAPRVGYTKMRRVKSTEGDGMVLQEEEFVVEKIVSRRFNPRKKQYEYLIKWEGYPSEQNTWEPAENMEACQHLLKAFEENLAKQSLAKQGAGGVGGGYRAPLSAAPRKESAPPPPGPSGISSHVGGRPVRYSKQKALNQVKAWCGSIKPDELELDNSDDDEETGGPAGKRLKLALDTDSEDSLLGNSRILYNKGGVVKKVGGGGRGRGAKAGAAGRSSLSNGGAGNVVVGGGGENLAAELGLESSGDEAADTTLALLNHNSIVKKVSSLSPANQQVLVANAKGVVKIDPSQVPNLTSGVYIMSNKSGIIKLDSVSPSKALSMKQGNVKEVSREGGVVMLKTGSAGGRTGIVRRNSPGILSRGGGGALKSHAPSRPPGTLRMETPNTRIVGSGTKGGITPNRPKLPLLKGNSSLSTPTQQKKAEIEKRILGPKPRGGGRGGGAISRTQRPSINKSISDESEVKGKVVEGEGMLLDLQQGSDSSESEVGLPDDFPVGELPALEPESPPRPLTLCPLTGKVLSKAEGERTPEPSPPHSPAITISTTTTTTTQQTGYKIEPKEIKAENIGGSIVVSSPTSSYLNKLANKEPIVKKTLKPGSIGSVTVSPKKILAEAAAELKSEDDMVTITGEDGLIYKVRNSELGGTLVVGGEDGQQCVYVTTGEDHEDSGTVLTLDPSYADAVAHLSQVSMLGGGEETETQFYVKETETGELVGLEVEGGEGADSDSGAQLVAQLVEAGEPQPGGGPRRVVLLLPDGNLMVTEVDEEQYAALELDK